MDQQVHVSQTNTMRRSFDNSCSRKVCRFNKKERRLRRFTRLISSTLNVPVTSSEPLFLVGLFSSVVILRTFMTILDADGEKFSHDSSFRVALFLIAFLFRFLCNALLVINSRRLYQWAERVVPFLCKLIQNLKGTQCKPLWYVEYQNTKRSCNKKKNVEVILCFWIQSGEFGWEWFGFGRIASKVYLWVLSTRVYRSAVPIFNRAIIKHLTANKNRLATSRNDIYLRKKV